MRVTVDNTVIMRCPSCSVPAVHFTVFLTTFTFKVTSIISLIVKVSLGLARGNLKVNKLYEQVLTEFSITPV